MDHRADGQTATAPSVPSPPLAATLRDLRTPERVLRSEQRHIANYEILEEIGRGGMSVVYKARQVLLDRPVALKMLRTAVASGEDLARFRAEAEAVARLAHPNIVQIHEIGEHAGQPFLSLEYVTGGSLDRYLDDKPLPPPLAARLVQTLASAVEFAHQHGIVHRDLKPANVLLQQVQTLPEQTAVECRLQPDRSADGLNLGFSKRPPTARCAASASCANFCLLHSAVVKIGDFGLAKRIDGPAGQTRMGEVLGTPSYMAPEQAEGRHPDIGPTTDVWALGAILYECLTGRPPFLAGTIHETLDQVRRHDPVPPRTLCPDLPRDLEIICLKCLDKAPGRRYASAAALAADLGHFLAGEPIVARPISRAARWVKWARSRPTAAALVVVSALLVVFVAAAIPLHVARLQARIQVISANMELAHQENLRAECERKLAEGREALASGDLEGLERAIVLFATVQERLESEATARDERLALLRCQAVSLREQASQAVDRRIGSAPARSRARKFLHLRDEAFFQLHHDLIGAADSERNQACLDACRKALRLFPDLDCLPAGERAGLRGARQEVLLLQAEATARLADGPEGLHEALELVEKAAGADGQSCGVRLRRSRYLGLLGDQLQAARERHLAHQIPPTTALDWFLLGHEHWMAGDLRGALDDFDRALTEQPELYWPRLLRAMGLHQLREHTLARAELDLCIRARPDYPRAYLLRALIHTETHRPDAAEADLRAAARLPLDPQARYALHITRGLLAQDRNQPARAVTEFQRAVLLGPRYCPGHANLAQAYWRRGWLDRAEAALDHALRLAPAQPDLHRTRSRLRTQRGNLPGALADLDRLLELESAEPRAGDLRERARLLYLLGRYPEALPACRRALARRPEDPVVLRLHAEVLLELGQYASAVLAFDRYLTAGRADVEVYRRRARARAATGDLSGVIEDYTLALTLRRDPTLLTARGWAHLVNQAPRPALRDFEAALALAPDDADALVGRASARFELGDLRTALLDVEKAMARRPESSRVLYNAARLLTRAAQVPSRQSPELSRRALTVLQQAVKATPAATRARFWQDKVCRDDAFRGLTSTPGFDTIARQLELPARAASSAR